MPRELTGHRVNVCNEALKITVVDEPGSGGACHAYDITGFNTETNPSDGDATTPDGYRASHSRTRIIFQNGPIKEAGVNGITQEVLLAIIEDRLVGFQSGPYACAENAIALELVRKAQEILQSRTVRRVEQGVEGTHQPDQPTTGHHHVRPVV